MAGRLTVLMENKGSKGLHSEHGLSFFIEEEGRKVLFDTGQSELFLKNAETLGICLEEIDSLIISHGHYDHANGLPALVKLGVKPSCYLGKGFFNPKYVNEATGIRFNGVNFSLEDLRCAGWEIHEISHTPFPLDTGDTKMWIVSDFLREDPYETIPARFVRNSEEGELIADTFTDEIMLVIESAKGLILIVGCSHPGIINMIERVKSLFDLPIYALIGGTHLVNADPQRIDHVISYLEESTISIVGIAHCTGENAVREARERGLKLIDCSAGAVLEWK